MSDRGAARIAWGLSAGLHILAVAGLWALVPSSSGSAHPGHTLDFGLVEVVPETPVPEAPSSDVISPPTSRPPTVIPIPAVLPTSISTFVRDRSDRPTIEDVQDVTDVQQVSATERDVVDSVTVQRNPQPMETVGNVAPAQPGNPDRTLSIHDPLLSGQTVVYVLDCSGTMGLGGKLARARSALLTTLTSQPAGVRALVVTYSGRAEPLIPGGLVEVTPFVGQQIAAALAKLEPAGDSRHIEGVRVALKFTPDVVMLLTDADDAELMGVRSILAGVRKPVVLNVARVTADGVEIPRPLR